MKLYSQRDPIHSKKILPNSKLTVGDYGCFLSSIATLGQAENIDILLKNTAAFSSGGLLIPGVLAKQLGMFYVGPTTTAPQGWCIGRTAKYASMGFPTHFLPVNIDTQEMIDPLKFPAKIEPLTYEINQYRVFTNIKFTPPPSSPVFDAPTPPQIPEWANGVVERAKKAGIETPLSQTVGSIPLYQVLLLIEKYLATRA